MTKALQNIKNSLDFVDVEIPLPMKRIIAFLSTAQILGLLVIPQGYANQSQNGLLAQTYSDPSEQSTFDSLEYGDETFQETSDQLAAIRRDFDGRSQAYTLDQAIAYAIANNPTIQAAYRSVQSKQWSAISDKRLWWPTASGAGPGGDVNIVPTWPTIGQRYTSSKARAYTTVETTDGKTYLEKTKANEYTIIDTFVPAVAGRWTFFDMPRGAVINSSTEAAKAEELLFNMTVRDTVLAVQEGYFALYSEIKFLDGLELDYRANVEQLSQAQAKYNADPTLINQNAVQQSKATLYAQLEQLISMHVKLIRAGANMAKAMGLPIGTLIKPSDDFQMRPLGSWDMELMPTIEHALSHREEILAAQTIAKSQSYLATSFSYSYLPKLSLYGYVDYNAQNGIYGASDAKKNNKTWSWGPSANIGLIFSWNFDGTVNDAKSRSAKYASKQSLAKAQASRDMVASQTATAFAEYTTAKMSLDTSKAALINAKRARDTSKILYQQNLIDATAFTAAANAVSLASEAYTKSIFVYNNSLAKLYRYTSIWPVGVSKMLDEAVKILKEG